MPRFAVATVTAVTSERDGLQRVDTTLGRAYVLTKLTGPVAEGDDVVLNTTAVDLGLGSGGWHVVHWNLANTDGWSSPGGGHVMKLRYTSLQADTGVAEEHDGYASPLDLGRRPVVAIGLHSQLAPVAVAFAHRAPGTRLVYVMTDGGALPIALSDVVADLRDRDLLAATVTAGQAFGGDHEAVNVTSALDVAVASAHADAIVVGTGPGVVGTGTTHGHSPLEVALTIDAAGASNADPIVALRVSDADSRARHRGVSHHSLTALARAARRASVAVPADDEHDRGAPVDVGQHDIVPVAVPDIAALLDGAGLRVTTMGRGPADEPRFFRYAAAAGVLAAERTRSHT